MKGLRKVAKRSSGKRRFENTRDDAALEATREKPCLLRGRRCTVTVWRRVEGLPHKEPFAQLMVHQCHRDGAEAHHVVTKARGGHDAQTVPLCRYAHQELHDIGQKAWEERWGVSLSVEQAKVWAEYQRRQNREG